MSSASRSSHDVDSGYDAAGPAFSLRRKIGLLLGLPLFLVLLWAALTPGLNEGGRRLLATSGLMAFWWITEAIPIPATALLPMCLYPLFGILPMAEVTRNYGDENIFLFLGGFFIAMAMQKWQLHRRLALHIVRLHPFLLMIPAAISASCAFMLPVATPPNAIVFACGYVTVPQMARAGIWLNLIGVVLVTAIVYMLVAPVLQIDFSSSPAWAR